MDLTGYIPMVTTTGGPDPKVDKTSFIHWTRASRQGPPGHNEWTAESQRSEPIPDAAVERMKAALPPVVRRDPKERYRAVLEGISRAAIESYRRTGRIIWPASAERELKEIAWKTGDPTLTDLGGIDQLQRQVAALTRHVLETNEVSQKQQDGHRTTVDWTGH
jgi:hypothetical protein